MAEPRGPQLFTIPAHRAFADALVAGLLRRFGDSPAGLARGLILLPNNRAKRTLTDAFVRASGGGLLLPRMVAVGDPALDESTGAALDPAEAMPVPAAVSPLQRRMILARLVAEERAGIGQPVDAAEAVRLAGDLARTLDQLLVEEVPPERLRALELKDELSVHWQRAIELFGIVLDRWPAELQRLGRIDLAERRRLLLDRLGARWREMPPAGFVCAAGVTDSAPAVARLLRCVSEMPHGMVVLPDLATEMPDEQWGSLGPHRPDPVTGQRKRSSETHPQFHLKLLLERMGVSRSEFQPWREGGGHDASAARGRAIANALAPASFTRDWPSLPPEDRRLAGIVAAELATPAEEAQAIALALREVLEVDARTAALVTPDRALARRVAAHLRRWGVEIDDTAGRPLSILPPGTLLLLLAEAAAQRFAPLALLALLKHPLVRSGEARGRWLDGVRRLDRVLRGPRPAPGLEGVDALLAEPSEREGARRARAAAWWPEARALLAPLGTLDGEKQPLASLLACLRETAQALCGDELWAGPSGRCAAELLAELELEAAANALEVAPDGLAPLLRVLMDEQSVRLQQGSHPRLAIYGLIEARLQTADLMILGGLNEGVWPGTPPPDPWLAPRIRAELDLPGLERRVGLSAHDLAGALGAPRALMTRSRRDAKSPAIASRFWLRLQALAGDGFVRARELEDWTRLLDDPGEFSPERQPAPAPPAALRPRRIAVTDVDRLKADPYAFYAKRYLRLPPLDAVDADFSAAWRGTVVHEALEQWARVDGGVPERLRDRALSLLKDGHPLVRALWEPRLMEAINWIAAEQRRCLDAGRSIAAVECEGKIEFAGVTLTGTADRLDRTPEGSLVVIDYKTGRVPSQAAIRAGFSLQLGLLGLIAERGGFGEVTGKAADFEYWALSRAPDRSFGFVSSPTDPKKREPIPPEDFTALAAANFSAAAGDWLTGDAPFTAKLHPEYAPYGEYDQLMRRDEWYGRG